MIQGPPIGTGPAALPIDLTWLLMRAEGFVMSVIVIIAGVVVAKWFLRSSLGEALAERIRARTRGRFGDQVDSHHVAGLEEQVSQLQAQVNELGERLDFAERMLARAKEPDRLRPAP